LELARRLDEEQALELRVAREQRHAGGEPLRIARELAARDRDRGVEARGGLLVHRLADARAEQHEREHERQHGHQRGAPDQPRTERVHRRLPVAHGARSANALAPIARTASRERESASTAQRSANSGMTDPRSMGFFKPGKSTEYGARGRSA